MLLRSEISAVLLASVLLTRTALEVRPCSTCDIRQARNTLLSVKKSVVINGRRTDSGGAPGLF